MLAVLLACARPAAPPEAAVTFPEPPPAGDPVVERLAAFVRLYGLVRWFHPSDEAAEADWELFARYGAHRVRASEDLEGTLTELFAPVAPTLRLAADAAPAPVPPAEGPDQVAWQHRGFGFSEMVSAYESVRLHRPREVLAPAMRNAIAAARADAAGLEGQEVVLRARVAAQGDTGARLWLRIDGATGDMLWFDNMMDRPVRTSEPVEVELRTTLPAGAATIVYGTLTDGGGSARYEAIVVRTGEREVAPPDWKLTAEGWKVDQDEASLAFGRETTTLEPPLFDAKPAPDESVVRPLGGGLWARVPVSLASGSRTLPDAREAAAALATAAAAATTDDADLRVADVAVGWTVLRHFYPYWDVVPDRWEEALPEALAAALAAPDAATWARALERLGVDLHDGHFRVARPDEPPTGALPVAFGRVEDRVAVLRSWHEEVRPGDIVSAIGGVPIERAWAEALGATSGSPGWRASLAARRLAGGPRDSETTLTLESADGVRDVVLAFTAGRRTPPEPPIRTLEDGVFVVDLSRAAWPEIEAILPELAAAPGVVFDLRGYPNSNHEVLEHLLAEKDDDEWMHVAQLLYPDGERVAAWEHIGWEMEPAKPHVEGRVAFLTGPGAISYAESVMGFVEAYRLGDIVGGPTAGANGNVATLDLPTGHSLAFTGMKVTKHDGSTHHLVGVTPTHPVAPTLAGLREGRDEVLEAGLARVREPR